MSTFKLTLSALLLVAFGSIAHASEQDDGIMLENAGFCSTYTAKLAKIGDDGTRLAATELFGRFNGPVFNGIVRNLASQYGDQWVNARINKGSFAAMKLSNDDALYNRSYSRNCNQLANDSGKPFDFIV